ncbi:hypothetical protein DBR32_07690 [Taibaiella sp. KBW10]|uniref:DUF4249 domain-containing protein n=1 Tax=Taibaiella sp. KBW10 TaxID=2153357 RepID=UPI000F5AA2A3|nr:DUF4249 domain-containing protein [Taibaiella sp. KBW10]RQO31814.1 hypothetical protein DBR32_07690 [Taibaiella sp. KBW10]
MPIQSYLSKLTLALLCIFTISSCRKEVHNIPLAKTDDIAIMQGFLNPDADTVTISLSVASGISKNKKEISIDALKNAQITIESNGIVKSLRFLSETPTMVIFFLPRTEMPVQQGKTYTVRAKNGDHFSLEATTTVPESPADFTFTADGPYSSSQNNAFYKIKTTIVDFKGQNNFYRTSILASSDPNYDPYSRYFTTDEKDQLAKITLTMQLDEETYRAGGNTIAVSHISESYYRFFKSVQTLEDTGGNPFAEPTALYTNVSGGIGVLGAMTVSYKDL